MFKNAKTDANQKEIVNALRARGATVLSLAPLGKGCPDLLVGYNRRNILMEVKTKAGKLTKAQEHFFKSWNTPIEVVRTVEEALVQLTRPRYTIQEDYQEIERPDPYVEDN